ncbi:cohesin domain-containing protein [Methanolobus sp. WCC5]|uniref:cohesin domain-containing protein n=1 Tax=Methanolobus sp. WCC5 TaxID=3125785 RepID=UPI00325069CB
MLCKDCCRRSATVLLFMIIILCLTGISSSQAVIGFSPDRLNVEENGSFTIDIMIASDVRLSGAELELSYDPALVNVASIKEGDFFKQEGKSTIFSKGEIDNGIGSVTGIYSVMIGNEILPDPGTFATITLNSKDNTGIAELEMRNVIVSNSAGDSLPVIVNSAQIIIGDIEIDDDKKAENAIEESQSSGQNSLIYLLLAIMCLYFLKKK